MLYDIFSCTCTILARRRDSTLSSLALAARSCTHAHTLRCYLMISSLGQNLPMDFQARFGKVTTYRQHEKRWKTCRLNFSSSMIQTHHSWHSKANREVFLYIEVQNTGCARSRVTKFLRSWTHLSLSDLPKIKVSTLGDPEPARGLGRKASSGGNGLDRAWESDRTTCSELFTETYYGVVWKSGTSRSAC